MRIKSNVGVACVATTEKAEEPKKVILPKVEVKEEKIEDPDDGEGEG